MNWIYKVSFAFRFEECMDFSDSNLKE